MDGLRQYVISLVTAAMICGILSGFFPSGFAKGIIRMLCALFMALTVLRPLADVDIAALTEVTLPYTMEAERASAAGEKLAEEAVSDIIKAETEAYILDKAAELNAAVSAQITVEDDQMPEKAVISGEISPYARARLEEILEKDLGITKEKQIWTG